MARISSARQRARASAAVRFRLLLATTARWLLWCHCATHTVVVVVNAQGADDQAADDFVVPTTDDPAADAPPVNITVTDDATAAADDKDLDSCFTTINGLALQESGADTTVKRIYQLCPNSVYGVGVLDFDNVVQGGQEPIPLRPNLHLKCGSDGLREDNCVVNGGDVQLDGTSFLTVRDSARIDNVTIEGVTFVGAFKYMVWLDKPGSVTFINCQFRENRKAVTPVLLDYFDPAETAEELSVTFQDCAFDDNVYGGSIPMDLAVAGVSRQASLIVGNSQQNRIVIENTVFRNNDMLHNNSEWQLNSFLVESSGPLTMVENCFENNNVGVSMVMSYHPELFLVENFGNASDGLTCTFSAHYTNVQEYQAKVPQCLNYDATECLAFGTPEPSMQPSSTPSWAPSNMPSTFPSDYPSRTPSVSPTSSPTTEAFVGSALSAAAGGRLPSCGVRFGAAVAAVLVLLM